MPLASHGAGGCLRDISPCSSDPSRVAVSLDDNVVRLVSWTCFWDMA